MLLRMRTLLGASTGGFSPEEKERDVDDIPTRDKARMEIILMIYSDISWKVTWMCTEVIL
jgi:hypothetical protein